MYMFIWRISLFITVPLVLVLFIPFYILTGKDLPEIATEFYVNKIK